MPGPAEHPESEFRAAEFFAGIGLARLVLEPVGFRFEFANDIDESKREM